MTRNRSLLTLLALTLLPLWLAIGATRLPAQEAPPPNAGIAVVRVYWRADQDAAARALTADYAVWEFDPHKRALVVDADADAIADLRARGFEVAIDPLLTDSVRRVRPSERQPAGIPGYACYRTVEETYASAAALAADHPTLAQWIDIGNSWEKNARDGLPGYDLMVLRLTNLAGATPSDDRPKLFVTSALHAREYATAELMTRFAEQLVGDYGRDADATWLLDHHDIHLLLHVNPDGRKHAESGLLWRKNTNAAYCGATSNSRGADLNRNFPYGWGCCGGSSGSQCAETYRGPSAASEPETQAIVAYARAIFPDQRADGNGAAAPADATGVYIDVHSYGGLVLWPWGFTAATAPNAGALQTLGRKLAYFNGYLPQQAIGLYPTDGATDDFVYGDLGVAAYTFEIGNAFFESCAAFENAILPTNLPALRYAAKVARTPYQTPAGPDALALSASPVIVAAGAPVTVSATLNDTRYETQNGAEPVQAIAAAELYIDTPPWAGGTPIALGAADGSFNSTQETARAVIDGSTLASGRRLLYVRGQDAAGNWGAFSATFVYAIDPALAPTIGGSVRAAGSNAPLAARVSALDGALHTTSDGAGVFSLQVFSGTHTIAAGAAGYLTQTQTLTVSDGASATLNFTLPPVCTLWSDDVESGNAGWATTGGWAIGSAQAYSPAHAWSDSPAGSYPSNANATLTSPVIDLSDISGSTLSFAQICSTEAGYDYCIVEASADGGGTWSEVARFDGSSSSWTPVNLDISLLDGSANARLRFRLTSDAYIEDDGWTLDDFVVQGGGLRCAGSVPTAVGVARVAADAPTAGAPAIGIALLWPALAAALWLAWRARPTRR